MLRYVVRRFSTNVYVNDKCLELEKLFLQCNTSEQILSLLVTHRPHLFLYNAVRTIELLAEKYSEMHNNLPINITRSHLSTTNFDYGREEISQLPGDIRESQLNFATNCLTPHLSQIKYASHPENMDVLLTRLLRSPEGFLDSPTVQISRDERYLLLLSDLYMHRNNLDIASICKVVNSLRVLNNPHYFLLNGLIKPLIKQLKSYLHIENWHKMIGYSNIDTAVKELLDCAKNFVYFGYFNTELYNIISSLIMQNNQNVNNFMEQIHIYSKIDNCTEEILNNMARYIENNDITPRQSSYVAQAFAKQNSMIGKYDRTFDKIVGGVLENDEGFTIDDLYRIITSTTHVKLHYHPLIQIVSRRLEKELDSCRKGALKSSLNTTQISELLHSLAYFGTCPKNAISTALSYLEDYIDDISPSDAQRILNAICFTGSQDTNPYALNFIWRKIGADISWERSAYEVFVLWLYHLIKFPWIAYNLPKRCIDEGFRQWAIHNTYGLDVIDGEREGNVLGFNYPFALELVNNRAKLIISDYARNNRQLPGGIDLLRYSLLKEHIPVEAIDFVYN